MKIHYFVWIFSAIPIVFSSSFVAVEIHFDPTHSLNISLNDILNSSGAIAAGLAQSFGNGLTPSYFFNFILNLMLAAPSQIATFLTGSICSAVLSNNAIKPDPASVPDIASITIQLRTACNIKEFPLQQLPIIVSDPGFDVNKNVVIASSGWLTNANKSNDVLEGLGKAYNCRNDTNFLGIDVGMYIQTLYTWSSLNTLKIGQEVAVALVNLTQVVPLEKFHLMGHSLGAQIVGEAARHFKRLTGQQIPRVTGFDPAGTCFNYGQKHTTLSASDADYVDIIHTNPGVAGQWGATGDADFFVGGHFPIQNGCLNASCSHQRSWQYYMESVYPANSNNFLAKRCDTLKNLQNGRCVGHEYPMGYATPKHLKGQFILEVNASPPYGKNASEIFMNSASQCGRCGG